MELRFDKYKPAGQITPSLNGAVFHQQAEDGNYYYFNSDGYPVDIDSGERLTIKAKAPVVVKVQSEVVTVDESGKTSIEIVEEDAKPVIDPKAELTRWVRGDDGAETNWMKVRGYGKTVLGKVASGAEDLAGMCVDAGLVNPSEVKAI